MGQLTGTPRHKVPDAPAKAWLSQEVSSAQQPVQQPQQQGPHSCSAGHNFQSRMLVVSLINLLHAPFTHSHTHTRPRHPHDARMRTSPSLCSALHMHAHAAKPPSTSLATTQLNAHDAAHAHVHVPLSTKHTHTSNTHTDRQAVAVKSHMKTGWRCQHLDMRPIVTQRTLSKVSDVLLHRREQLPPIAVSQSSTHTQAQQP